MAPMPWLESSSSIRNRFAHPEVGGSFSGQYQTNNGLLAYSLAADGNHSGWIWSGRFSDKYARAYSNPINGPVSNSGYRERAGSAILGRNGSWGYTRLRFSYFHLHPGMIEGEGENFGYTPALPFQHVRHYKVVSDNTFHVQNGNVKVILGWQQNRRQEYEESEKEAGLDFRLNTVNYDVRWQGNWNHDWKTAVGLAGMFQKSDNLGDEFLIPAYGLFDAGLFATATKTLGEWTLSGGIRADIRWLHSEGPARPLRGFQKAFSGRQCQSGSRKAPG